MGTDSVNVCLSSSWKFPFDKDFQKKVEALKLIGSSRTGVEEEFTAGLDAEEGLSACLPFS